MIIIEKAYKYRIYPNKIQQVNLNKTLGCARFVYNYYLNKRKEIYENNKSTFDYNKCCKDLTVLKTEIVWLAEAESTALQSSLRNLDNAFKDFFKAGKGYPKFKSKKTNRFSYTSKCTNGNIQYLGKVIKLPKIGMIKTRNKLVPEGRIISATVTKEPSGKYFVSILCTDVPEKPLLKTNKNIGIDLGIKDFATLSNLDKIPNPKYLIKSEAKLAKLQRELSRKPKGSSNRNKARIKIARLNEKISNQRKDFLQKLSTKLIRNFDVICIENLEVDNMIKNHKLAKNIADVSWSEFTRQLEYKSNWYGRQVVKVDTWYASSQICHVCNCKDPITKDLKVRNWKCPVCGSILDRDTNAAINILNKGLRILEVA